MIDHGNLSPYLQGVFDALESFDDGHHREPSGSWILRGDVLNMYL